MNEEGGMGGTMSNEKDAEPPAAAGRRSSGATAIWIEAPWRPADAADQVAMLLYDPERRTVALTRRLQLPSYAGTPVMPGDAADVPGCVATLAARIGMATGCTVRGLRSLHRIDIDDGIPGACTHVLAVACAQQPEHETAGLSLLDIDEAVHMADAGVMEDNATACLLKYAQRHLVPQRPLTIVVTGPCEPDADSDPALLAAHVAAMEACVLPLYEAGHLPVLGEWLAQPTARLAGAGRHDAVYDRLLARCDGVLRVGGASKGADPMVAMARRLGKAVYDALDDVPGMRPRLVSDHPMLYA
jgi:hypothetical protein